MRINESVIIKAPGDLVWEYIENPDNYLHFMSGITRWEVVHSDDGKLSLGARVRMLIKVGAAEVGGKIEIVEYARGRDMAWSSVTGVDQRGRWRVRKAGEGLSRVELRYAYGVAGAGVAGVISELVAAPSLRRHLRRSLLQLKRQVEHEQLRRQSTERRETAKAG